MSYEDRQYLNETQAARDARVLEEAKREKQLRDEAIIAHEDAVIAREQAVDNFFNYKADVKKTLVKEALMHFCEGATAEMNDRVHAMYESLVGQYIDDVTVEKLFSNMKFSENALLRTIYEAEEEAFSDITADANVDDAASQTINPESIEEFWKRIDKAADIEDINNIIRLRVSNAEEDFVNKNKEDRSDVKTIIKDTADRVKLTDDSSVEESETMWAKDRIYQIQHEGYRTVFDRMVRNLSEVAMKDEEFSKEYTTEGGRLDVDKVVETARCMYTLLEVVGTIGLENVDAKYIEDSLKSIGE